MSFTLLGQLCNFVISIWTLYQVCIALSSIGMLWPVVGMSVAGILAVAAGIGIDKARFNALTRRFTH